MEHLTEKNLKHLEFMANRLRQDVIKMVSDAGSGHIAGPLDMAEIFTAFYFIFIIIRYSLMHFFFKIIIVT
jgi:transketolase